MNKRVRKIRKSISQRNKDRAALTGSEKEQSYYLPDTEEKHGYPPSISSYSFREGKDNAHWASFLMKGILSAILFLTVAILMDTNQSALEQPREVAEGLLQNEFPFANVNVWYQDLFGSPLALAPEMEKEDSNQNEKVMPVQGTISEDFQLNGQGVKISPGETTDVFSHQEGVVIFAGNKDDTDKTITIQHADGTNSSYGHLSEINVHLYQYVSQNQRIGNFTPESNQEAVYFSVEKDNHYIDPIEVIEVDDVP